MALIAVIDDVAVNRELLGAILKPLGHRIVEAADGAAALELVQRERPALIICDILMPEIDGYEFVRRLRANPSCAEIPVVLCTAHFLEPEAQHLAEICGVRRVLVKPVDPQEVIDVVDAILDQGVGRSAHTELSDADFDQRHLHLISGKLSHTVAELRSTNDKLAALVELNLQLASERAKGRLLAHFCEGARELLGAEFATVAVRWADSETLAYVKHSSVERPTDFELGSVDLSRGALADVYRNAETLRLDWPGCQGLDSGLPGGHSPLRQLLAAPVKSLSATYGWICVGNPVSGADFTAADEELLRILAAQTGRIYENGSLYAKLREYAHELESGIVERDRARGHLAAQYAVARILGESATLGEAAPRLLAEICHELQFDAASLWRVEERDEVLRCVESWCEPRERCAAFLAQSQALTLARGEGLPGLAWGTGEASWLSDLQDNPLFLRKEGAREAGLTSGGAVPILAAGRVIGVIDVYRNERCALEPALANTLATLGGQIGQFFEKAAQQRRILRLTRVYAVLSGINAAIVRIHDRLQLFREACAIAVNEGEFGIAWIGEVDPDNEAVTPLAWAGLDDDLATERVSLREDADGFGAIVDAVRSGSASVVNDLGSRAAPARRGAEAHRRGYRSLIVLPLTVEQRVAGVIVLYAREPEFFTAEEQALLRELANDISFALEYIAKQDLLAFLAYHDVLTGLPNRAHLLDRLTAKLQAKWQHPRDRVAVVLWDVKRFRHINDTLGRQAGDGVLRELAQRLAKTWPDAGDLARITVDQFGGVLSGRYELTDIAHLIERTAAEALGQPIETAEHALHVALCTGIAVGGAGEDADTLFRNAEAALREAKSSGAPYLFYGPEMNARIAETLMLENRLRQALERDEFVLHYQPKVAAKSGKVVGLEALLRWDDPATGLVQPAAFIPLLEDTGMIVTVGLWAIRKALADIRSWRAAGITPPRVAVNVSPLQLQQKDFVASLRKILDESGESVPWLELEITESMIMADLQGNAGRLAEIRSMGVEIAIDDFGTGYSSLGYLAKLPVGALKIDRSFVSMMTAAEPNTTIVSTIVSLAHSLKLKVIAEGVEDEAQASLLRQYDCDELQGFLISRPMPPEQVVAFVRGAPPDTR